ncbi:hypothetical protein KS4_08540 [Poriferisphaera corsica]|uniref:Uncharacterized protein n=1 Tax=Poriferisphaera corsica TaxID=2528020 RepID=A0A517YRG1_9BACT|nr:hypothetical protein [Poriferisphaera corsica]QDU32818.1 hypothetical protein KS4_08540 [Poriferisphaera corsica]
MHECQYPESKKWWANWGIALLLVVMCGGVAFGAVKPRASLEERKANAAKTYAEYEKAYLSNDWDKVEALSRSVRGMSGFLKADEKLAVRRVQSYMKIFRPKWWKHVSSPQPITFDVNMWGNKFTANYAPDKEQVGVQMVLERRNRQGRVIDILPVVSWRPQYINSPTPAVGELADLHKITMGNYVEVIVRHELGHNYITTRLPKEAVVELYRYHGEVYGVLQEFYADLTALRHSTPKAMRITCWARLFELDHGDKGESHYEASVAIGFLLLHEFMSHPDKWPSVHFPGEVPQEGDVMIETVKYVYEHWDKDWSLAEDIRLREFVYSYLKKNGEKVFRSKGTVTVSRGLGYAMMIANDYKLKAKRDKWISDQLKKLIASGRADKLPEEGEVVTPMRLERPYERRELEQMKKQ